MHNAEYWSNEGAQKTFTHPLCSDWIMPLGNASSVLDVGCGYGRLTPELIAHGFNTIVGYDYSTPLINRAFHENPGAYYTSDLLALEKRSFDLVLCFALFTSCPSTKDQLKLTTFINEHTNTEAYLYISDYEMVDNPEYKKRYEEKQLNLYGCFKSSNAIFRHHEAGHFDKLFSYWERLKQSVLPSKTLNGNEIQIHQYLFKKS